MRDDQVGHSGIERRNDFAIVQVVFGGTDRRCAPFALRGKRVNGKHTVLRLAELCVALRFNRLSLFIGRERGLYLSLRQKHLRTLLLDSLLL